MTTSSAKPQHLDDFVASATVLDPELLAELVRFVAAYDAFAARPNELATAVGADGSSPPRLEHFGPTRALAQQHASDLAWERTFVGAVAEGFKSADAHPSAIVTVDDAVIAARLQEAGLPNAAPPRPHDVPAPDAAGLTVTSGWTDDPVNAASGNFLEHAVDLVAPERLRTLRWERVYNSRFLGPGPLGRGWSSWASARLDVQRSDAVTYHGPDGQQVVIPRLALAGPPHFVVPPSMVASLTAIDGGYLLAWQDGERWTYDEHGLLTAVARGASDRTTFERDADDRLISMRHQTGATIELRWKGSRIVTAVGLDGAQVAYTYDDVGDLVEAGEPGARHRYEVADGLITALVDGDGVVLARNTYDALGRVATQRSPHGRLTRFTHLPGPSALVDDASGGSRSLLEHDPAGRLTGGLDAAGHRFVRSLDAHGDPVRVTDRRGDDTTQEFDDLGRCTRRVNPDGGEWRFEWDPLGRSTAVVAPNGAVTRFAYEGEQRWPSRVVDPLGAITTLTVIDDVVHRVDDPDSVSVAFEYDDRQQVVAIVNGLGHRQTIERDVCGRVVATTRPSGAVTRFTYDDAGRVVSRTDADGSTWHFTWTVGGRPASIIEPDGATTAWTYGPHGDVRSRSDATGAVTECLYDVLGNLAGIVGPDGARWELDHDGLCQLVALRDPLGHVERRSYDPEGALVGVTDALGRTTTATVDRCRGTVRRTDPLGQSWTSTTDQLGRVVEARAPDGTSTSCSRDLAGRVVAATDASGAVTRFEHTPGGRLARRISPLGHIIAFTYDAAGQLVAVADPLGAETRVRRDADGLITRVHHPTGEIERYLHDRLGRIVEHHAPDGGVTRRRFDHRGATTSLTDPTGGTRRFTYDGRGRLVASVDALGGRTIYTYDVAGKIETVTDSLGGVTRYEHDLLGRLTGVIDPLGRRTTMTWDAAGQLVKRELPTGDVVSYTYDEAGRVCGVRGGDLETLIERDAVGRPTHVVSRHGEVFLAYDAVGRLVHRDDGDLALAWRYDADGNRTAVVLPDGSAITYRFDVAGRVVAIAHPTAGEARFRRDASGRVVGYDDPTQQRTWIYQGGRLASFTRAHADRSTSTTFERDGAGRVVRAVGADDQRWTYDAAGQLCSWTSVRGTSTFDYDAGGRLAAESTGDGRSLSYEHDAAGQLRARVVDGTRTIYEHDLAGRRVSERSASADRRFTWDGFGRVRTVSDTSMVDGTGHVRTTCLEYDALGDLAQVGETSLRWDPVAAIPQVRVLAGHGVLGGDEPLGIISGDGPGAWFDIGWTGDVGWTGEVGWARDVGGGVRASAHVNELDPWGASAPGTSERTAAEVAFAYRGELSLGIGDLVSLRNRAYDPATRSFLSVDPLAGVPGLPCSSTPYHYAANDPVNRVDPLGLRPLTQDQYHELRDKQRAGLVVGAITTMAGAALCFAPIPGAQILGGAVMSAGVNMISQGTWPPDMAQVGMAAAVGGVGGGAFSLATSAGASMGVAGAFSGFEASMTSEAFSVAQGHPFKPEVVVMGTAFGGVAGWAGGKLAPRGSTTDAGDALGSSFGPGATVHHTPTATAIGDDTATLVNLRRSVDNGTHDVIVHGQLQPDGVAEFVVGGNMTHPQHIAQAVRENPAFAGQPITLDSCYGASGPAQHLADALGVPVRASTGRVRLDGMTGALVDIDHGTTSWFHPGGGPW